VSPATAFCLPIQGLRTPQGLERLISDFCHYNGVSQLPTSHEIGWRKSQPNPWPLSQIPATVTTAPNKMPATTSSAECPMSSANFLKIFHWGVVGWFCFFLLLPSHA